MRACFKSYKRITRNVGILILAIVTSLGLKRKNKQQPSSDHFDGKRFFNLDPCTLPRFRDVLRLMWSLRPEKWPPFKKFLYIPQIKQDIKEGQIVITFVNHATVLIQFNGFTILTDPIWSKRASPFSWIGPKRRQDPGVRLEELPPIDLILISHNHYDHLDIPTLKKLYKKPIPHIVVPLGNQAILKRKGISSTELDWWESLSVSSKTKIIFTPSQHFSSRGLFDRNKSLWGGYMIEHENIRIYFGGDTAYASHFKEIRKKLGAPDISFLPIGAYEPRWFMKNVHMNPKEAVKAHLDLQTKLSIGIHFGTFALTQESPDKAIIDLKKAKKNESVSNDSFITLGHGQSRVWKK